MANKLSIEQKIKRLEAINLALEQNDIDLNEALQMYEEGITLIKSARKDLADVEQKIETLSGNKDIDIEMISADGSNEE
jgi:exodeoxyribonuclease VII small subunit